MQYMPNIDIRAINGSSFFMEEPGFKLESERAPILPFVPPFPDYSSVQSEYPHENSTIAADYSGSDCYDLNMFSNVPSGEEDLTEALLFFDMDDGDSLNLTHLE